MLRSKRFLRILSLPLPDDPLTLNFLQVPFHLVIFLMSFQRTTWNLLECRKWIILLAQISIKLRFLKTPCYTCSKHVFHNCNKISTFFNFPLNQSNCKLWCGPTYLPMAVQASPITTPGGVTGYILSWVNTGFPTNSCKFVPSTFTKLTSSFTTLKATFLTTWDSKKLCILTYAVNHKYK